MIVTWAQRVLRRSVAVGAAIVLLASLGLVSVGTASAAAGDIGYVGPSYSGASNVPTSDKPQSKLWYNDGTWWATMFSSTAKTWRIFRLNRATEQWTDTGTVVDTRPQSLSDALWDGQHLYIASHYVTISTPSAPKAAVTNKPARLYRYSYSPTTMTYTLDGGFPTQITTWSSESLTIDKDTTGRIWATWTQVSGNSTSGFTNTVYVNDTGNGDKNWGIPRAMTSPGAHPAPDDISAIVAYKGRMGLMWSNQLDGTMYWSWRNDSEATTTWHDGVAVRGSKLADDHMNLKTLQSDSAGRVFAAVKTSLDALYPLTSSQPQLNLLVFKPSTGAWSSTLFGTIAECHTRPLVMLDETNQKVHVFATAPSSGGCPYSGAPGTIYEKSAPLDNPVFPSGRGTPVIRDAASANMNDATSTKQSVTAQSGLVVLASNTSTKRYWHADLSLGTVQAPAASFTANPTSGTAPLSVQFTDTSTGGPTSWSWDFGDGQTSTLQSPSHTYASGGSYTVTLVASNSGGSSAPATSSVTVSPTPAPTASFTPVSSTGPAPLSVQFTDTSTGSPDAWSWDFGDGLTSTAQSPSHTYTNAGSYTVTLVASRNGSASAPFQGQVTVNPAPPPTDPPTASFTADPTAGTAPLSVQFTDTSSGGATSWSWDFGDGQSSTAQNPSHTYGSAGSYPVTLVAANGAGPSTPATATVTVDPASSAAIRRESVSTTEVTTAANGITIAAPPGTAAGDVLVSCLSLNGSNVTSGGVPAGWSLLAASTAASNPKVYGYYKVATASEPADYSWTFGSSIVSSGGIARYSGSSGPDGAATKAASATAATTATVPGVTTTVADDMLVGCMGVNSGVLSITMTPPTGASAAWDLAGKRNQLADETQPVAGPSGDQTWTFSASRAWAGWLVALRPS